MVVPWFRSIFFCVLLRLMREEVQAAHHRAGAVQASKRRGEKVIPAAVGQKKQTEQEKQGIENREQGSDQRMNDNELVTHISRSHGGDVGAPDGSIVSVFSNFSNSSSAPLR